MIIFKKSREVKKKFTELVNFQVHVNCLNFYDFAQYQEFFVSVFNFLFIGKARDRKFLFVLSVPWLTYFSQSHLFLFIIPIDVISRWPNWPFYVIC